MDEAVKLKKKEESVIFSLKKSPCRECEDKDLLPACSWECRILKDLQLLLSEQPHQLTGVGNEDALSVGGLGNGSRRTPSLSEMYYS